jgi:hypothetical protein
MEISDEQNYLKNEPKTLTNLAQNILCRKECAVC